MAKVAVNELSGNALDWAVATAEGWQEWDADNEGFFARNGQYDCLFFTACHFSTEAEQALPIIEREGIAFRRHSSGTWYAMMSSDLGDSESASWVEMTAHGGERYGDYSYQVHKRRQRFEGPTPLVAAMRCYVARKHGAEVDVPDELLEAM